MSTEKTEGIVIKQADFSESSRVVTFFTRDWGKITTLAKGAKRLKGPFDAAIDLLTVCRIVFIRKSSSSLDLLTEAQLISRFQPGTSRLTGLYGGYYLAELLVAATEEYDPHPVLFQEAVETLDRLAREASPRLAILRFELTVLREMGQLPELNVCVACGRSFTGGELLAFWVSQGGLICSDCQKKEFQSRRLQPGSVALLRRLSGEGQIGLDRLSVSPPQYAEIRQFVTSAVCFALGKRPRMLRYLQN